MSTDAVRPGTSTPRIPQPAPASDPAPASAPAPACARPLVVVSVGTDHHRFDRLMDWVDDWLAAGAAQRVDCVVQHGSSRPTRLARGSALIPHEELQDLIRRADVVICHGGPTTIMEARRRGLVPLVVPRSGQAGEHVDNHQELFAARMAAEGLVLVADSQPRFAELVEAALSDPDLLRVAQQLPDGDPVDRAAARFGELVAELGPGTAGQATPVLFIGGSGRSGTTLLERLLGQLPGVSAAGELVHLWQRGVIDGERCGCGEPFEVCPFWQQVGQVGYGGWQRLSTDWMLDTRWAVDRTRRVPWLVLPGLATPGWRRRMHAWARHLRLLYAAIATVGAARLVVDSSKHLSYALLLRHVGVRMRVALVIRDPRAVAYAWSKLARRPEVVGAGTVDEYMPRFGVVKSTLIWWVNTLGYGILRLLRVPVHVVRYEDLVADPAAELAALAAFAGLTGPVPPIVEGGLTLAPDHTAAGNPIRFHTGPIRLRLDAEWVRELPAHRRWAVTALTWPLLLRFGYPLRSRVRPRPPLGSPSRRAAASG